MAYLGAYTKGTILFDNNIFFDLFPEFFANLTASLSPDVNASVVLAIINGTQATVPSPLDCVVLQIHDVMISASNLRRKALDVIMTPIPSTISELKLRIWKNSWLKSRQFRFQKCHVQ